MEPGRFVAKSPLPFIHLDRAKPVSLQVQLALSLKTLVQTGVLRPGKPVPSSRELAFELQVSRNTVVQALDRLVGEGYLEASPRRGLFVSASLAERNLRKARLTGATSHLPRLTEYTLEQASSPVPFQPCQPDVRLFPLQLWNRLRAKALARHGDKLLHYQSQLPLGLPVLRQSLAGYLQSSRGVRCDWRQIAITTGSQQALFLLAQLLLRPGSRVAMEDPGYLGARLAWRHSGATICPLPVDGDGIVFPREKRVSYDLVYTTPSRQFPTGGCLSLARRLALLDFAAKKRVWIVEDDYDSEFRYSRGPLPSVQSLDSSQHVIYVGSTSKLLFPSLRIGYLVLPVSLMTKFATLRAVLDDHGPLIDQATMAEFIDTGALYTHIRRSRREYSDRLEAFVDSAAKLAVPLEFPHIDGGMNLAGFFRDRANDAEWSLRLKSKGLEIPPLSRYSIRAPQSGLLFGFSAFTPNDIGESMKMVARTFSAETGTF